MPSAQEFFISANQKYLEGDYTGARADYTQAIRAFRDYPEAFFGRGRTHEALGNLDAAIRDYTEALRLKDGSYSACTVALEKAQARSVSMASAGASSGSADAGGATGSAELVKITDTDLELGQRIGSGGFGEVYVARWKGTPVAVKRLKAGLKFEDGLLALFEKEARLHASFKHPNIIALYGACLEAQKYSMVMELAVYGSLFSVLSNCLDLPWPLKFRIASDICHGLLFLHTQSPPVLHRDLKSQNILLDGSMRAKLSDFGLSKVKQSSSRMTPGAQGTYAYMSPELFRGAVASERSDMYALAMVLWEMSAHREPYYYEDFETHFQLMAHVGEGKREKIPLPQTPAEFAEMITACWAQEPTERPNIRTVAEKMIELSSADPYEGAPGEREKLQRLQSEMEALKLEKARLEDKKRAQEAAAQKQAEAAKKQAEAEQARRAEDAKRIQRLEAEAARLREEKARLEGERRAVAAAAVASSSVFAPAGAAIPQTEVNQLLLHVARGEQDEAEGLLKKNRALALQAGTVTDYSERTFENITAFQYALWALDWHMWTMILKYLPQDQAGVQLQALESRGTPHGRHYDFGPLMTALKTYIDNYDSWNSDQCEKHWCEVVGGAQKLVPAHVANEYCRADRSFNPTPPFTERTLPRVSKLDVGSWFPLEAGGLGSTFGCFRASAAAQRMWAGRRLALLRAVPRGFGWLQSDFAAVAALCKVRTSQYAELMKQLSPQASASLGYRAS